MSRCSPYKIVMVRGDSTDISPGSFSTMPSKLRVCPSGVLSLTILLSPDALDFLNLRLFISRKGTRLMRKNV